MKWIACASIVLAAMAGSNKPALGQVQAKIDFLGGNGDLLIIRILEPVHYVIDVDPGPDAVGPVFVFQDAGDAFGGTFVFGYDFSYSVNGVGPYVSAAVNSGRTRGDVTADDIFIGSDTGIALGDLVVLHSRQWVSWENFAGPPPASGTFNTFIADADGRRISIPEPAFTGVIGLAGVCLLRRRHTPAVPIAQAHY